MIESALQTLTSVQIEQLQRQYLRLLFCGIEPSVTDKSLEADGRKRSRVVKEAINLGMIVPTDETSWNGKVYRVAAEVIASVVPSTFDLFELWTELHNKNSHREAYERPWIRVDDEPIDVQCAFLNSDQIDWFVVSRVPYERHASFSDTPETVAADGRPSDSFDRYWAGPFPRLDDAITRRKTISESCLAVSSTVLRAKVSTFFAERKIQRLFANNLLWGLVEIARVPNDLLFDSNDKPTIDSQLEVGHSLRFESNPNGPVTRSEVDWEGNLTKSIERLKSRIAKAEEHVKILRLIDTHVKSIGGWNSFMDGLENRLRETVSEQSAASS